MKAFDRYLDDAHWDAPASGQASGVSSYGSALAGASGASGGEDSLAKALASVQAAAAAAGIGRLGSTAGAAVSSVDLREARRLYFGNVPAGTNSTLFTTFVNQSAAAAGLIPVGSTAAISSQVATDKNYAFVEFATLDGASACLGLDGIVFMGVTLKVKRPSNYKPPPAGMGGDLLPSAVSSAPMSLTGAYSLHNPSSSMGSLISLPPDAASALRAGAGGSNASGSGSASGDNNRVQMSGFPVSMTEQQVKDLAAKYGQLSHWDWQGTHAVVGYYSPLAADMMMKSLNGMPMGDDASLLKVQRVIDASSFSGVGGGGGDAVGGGGDGGLDGAAAAAKAAVPSAIITPDATIEQHIGKVLQYITSVTSRAIAQQGSQIPPATNILRFFRLLIRHELAKPLEYDDILDDIREECSMHGAVTEVNILKPLDDDPTGEKANDPVDVFVVFESPDAAQAALLALAGCTFNDRVIIATFSSQVLMDYAVQRNAGLIPAYFDKSSAIVIA